MTILINLIIKKRYPRFGHSLNSVTLGDDEDKEIMILAGGYAPNPMNDVWITEDGYTWAYVAINTFIVSSHI